MQLGNASSSSHMDANMNDTLPDLVDETLSDDDVTEGGLANTMVGRATIMVKENDESDEEEGIPDFSQLLISKE